MKINFLLLIALISSIYCYSQTSDEYFISGNVKYKLKDYYGAKDDFTKVIEINPQYGKAYCKRGNAELYLEDYNGALIDFNKALEINPKDDEAEKGKQLSNTKEDSTAKAVAEAAVAEQQIDSISIIYSNIGEKMYEQKDYNGAIKNYNKVIEINSQKKLSFGKSLIERENFFNKKAYYYRGLAEIKLGQKNGCLDLKKASELGFYDAYEAIESYCNKSNSTSYSRSIRGIKLGMTKNQIISFEKTKGTRMIVEENGGERIVYCGCTFIGLKGNVSYSFINDKCVKIFFTLTSTTIPDYEAFFNKMLDNFGPMVNKYSDENKNHYVVFKNGIIMITGEEVVYMLTAP